MADVSFAYVPAEGFTAFSTELSTGIWGAIDVSTFMGADGRPVKPMGTAPATVVMKVQMKGALAELLGFLKTSGIAKVCDDHWDEHEKRLCTLVAAAIVSKNPFQKAAGERLHKMLLLGDGTKQIKLKYHQEVDFGRKQVLLAAEGQCAADIALLGLGDVMADISLATDALAAAIGHGITGQVPSRRKLAATQTCRHVFAAVMYQLDWIAQFGQTGADKEQALTLQVPLVELAARYPSKPMTSKAKPGPTPPTA